MGGRKPDNPGEEENFPTAYGYYSQKGTFLGKTGGCWQGIQYTQKIALRLWTIGILALFFLL